MLDIEKLKQHSLDNPNLCYYLYSYTCANGYEETGITANGIALPLEATAETFKVLHIAKNGEIII